MFSGKSLTKTLVLVSRAEEHVEAPAGSSGGGAAPGAPGAPHGPAQPAGQRLAAAVAPGLGPADPPGAAPADPHTGLSVLWQTISI